MGFTYLTAEELSLLIKYDARFIRELSKNTLNL